MLLPIVKILQSISSVFQKTLLSKFHRYLYCDYFSFWFYCISNINNNICLQLIKIKTKEVLKDNSILDVQLETLETIFAQENLDINSELDLFNAAERYIQGYSGTSRSNASTPGSKRIESVVCVPPAKKKKLSSELVFFYLLLLFILLYIYLTAYFLQLFVRASKLMIYWVIVSRIVVRIATF